MGNFPKFRPKNQKLSILTENWHTWYIGGFDSESRLRFLKFRPQNPFLGKCGPKKSKLFVGKHGIHGILEVQILNPDLDFWNSYPKIHMGKFGSKKSKLSLFPENWHTWHLDDADSYSNIIFLNFQPYIHFWANLGQKSQSCLFCLKIGTHVMSRLLILVPTLVFWISKSKSIFGQIWTEKLKVVKFG